VRGGRGVDVGEQLEGGRVLHHRPPRSGRLHRPEIRRRFVRRGPDEIERERAEREFERLLGETVFLCRC
jgi:hypothetical protein